jgi:hypothetical protein
MTRDVVGSALGLLVGVGVAVGLCVSQCKPRPSDGRRVVAWVRKNRVVETPLAGRCLVLGLGLGILGGVAGRHLGRGAGVVPTAAGAVLAAGLFHHVQSGFPAAHGRAGEDTRTAGLAFAGFLGAAVVSRAALDVRTWSRRH